MKHQRLTISALITNNQGKILVIQRSQDDSFPGQWELPSGRIEWGEDPQEAVIREVKEETGLDVGADLYFIDSYIDNRDSERHFVRIGYKCHLLKPDQKVVLSHEHQAYKWISLDEENELQTSRFFDRFIEKMKTK